MNWKLRQDLKKKKKDYDMTTAANLGFEHLASGNLSFRLEQILKEKYANQLSIYNLGPLCLILGA